MPGRIRWTFRAQPDPAQDYVIAATRGLRIRWWHPRRCGSFLRYAGRIQGQLDRNSGCIAYSLRTTLFPFEGWTVSVWDTIDSLRRFRDASPHAEAMRTLGDQTKGYFRFAHWQARGDAIPTSWREAEGRLDAAVPRR